MPCLLNNQHCLFVTDSFDKVRAKGLTGYRMILFNYRLFRLNRLSTVAFFMPNSRQRTFIIRNIRKEEESTDIISPCATLYSMPPKIKSTVRNIALRVALLRISSVALHSPFVSAKVSSMPPASSGVWSTLYKTADWHL